MRSLLLTVMLLGTVLAGDESKLVIRIEDILSVRAIVSDVEITVSAANRAMPDEGFDHPLSFVFSFVMPTAAAKDIYISYTRYTPDVITIGLRAKDAKAASDLAASIDAMRPKKSNQSMQLTPSRTAFTFDHD
jgi:hypothetical protein